MTFSRLRTMSRWRLAALGTAGTGVAYLGLRTAFDDHFDLYNVGAARFVSAEYCRPLGFTENGQFRCWYADSNEDHTYRASHVLVDLGWIDLDLGKSPNWWAATVATYCPSRVVEHPKSKSTKASLRGHGTPCINKVYFKGFISGKTKIYTE